VDVIDDVVVEVVCSPPGGTCWSYTEVVKVANDVVVDIKTVEVVVDEVEVTTGGVMYETGTRSRLVDESGVKTIVWLDETPSMVNETIDPASSTKPCISIL